MALQLFTIKDIARLFGVSLATARKWSASGELASIRPGGIQRFTQQHIDTFIEKSQRTTVR